MPSVLVAHRSETALEHETMARLIAALRQRGHQVEHTSGASLANVERAAEAADHILLVDPPRWWSRGSGAGGWPLLLRERLGLCAVNEVEQFAVVLHGSSKGVDGPLGAVPRFVLPAAWEALLDRLAQPRRATPLLSTGKLAEPRPFIARPTLDRAIEQAIAAEPHDTGRLVWIRGGMGTGKTTLLRTCLGRRDPQSTVVHVARPGIAATLRPSAVLEQLAAKLASPVLIAIDGLEQLLDRTDALVPEAERRELAERLAGPLSAGLTVVATSRPLAPGLLGAVEPTIDLDAPRWAAEQQALIEALLVTSSREDVTQLRELAGSNPGAARALLDLGASELADDEVPPRFADMLERAFVRLLQLPGELRRPVLDGLALLRVAPGPVPERLLATALGSKVPALLERHAAEWLRREPDHLALTHSFAARYLAAELDPRDRSPHFAVLDGLARLRQRGPLDDATLAYATRHERGHQQVARGLSSDELWLRTVPELQRAAGEGKLEAGLAGAVESAPPERVGLVEAMSAIARRHSHALTRAPELLPSLLWTELVARGFSPSTLEAELSWAELRPSIRLQNRLTNFDRCHRILPGRELPVRGCGLSRDARVAITLHNDGTLYIWDLEANRARELKFGGWSEACALTRDGRRAALGTHERVLLIDIQRGEQLAEHKAHKASVTAIAISEDGQRVLSADRNGTVLLWNVQSSEPYELGSHSDRVTRCVMSSDGELGATGGDDKVGRVWSFSEARLLHELPAHPYAISALALTRDAKQLVSIGIGEARVWDPVAGVQLQRFDKLGESAAGAVLVADEREVLVAESGELVTRWQPADGKITARHLAHGVDMYCISASDDGEWYLTGGGDHVGRLWRRADMPSDEQLGSVSQVYVLLPGEQPGTVWISAGGQPNRLIALADQRELVKLPGYASATALACSGAQIFVTSSDRRVAVYSSTTGAAQAHWQPGKDWLRALAIDRARERLAFAGDDKAVFVSALDGSGLRNVGKHSDWIHALAFTPSGQLLAADRDGHIKLWDLDAERAVLECSSKLNNCIYAIMLDATGTEVAVAGSGGVIEIYSLADGQLLRKLEGHTGLVRGLALRSDGRVLVSAGADRTLRLWSFADGRLLTSMTVSYPLSQATFVGEQLVVGDVTGNVMIFEVDWGTIER